MERDYRLTGTKRGQSSNHEAPQGFELSNPWKVRTSPPPLALMRRSLTVTARETDFLDRSWVSRHVFIFACSFFFNSITFERNIHAMKRLFVL